MPKQTKPPSAKLTGNSSLRFGVPNGGGFEDSMNFGQSNGFASSQLSDFNEEQEDQMEPEEEEVEEEEEAEEELDLSTQDPQRTSTS